MKKIISVNCGSSSLKFQLFEMPEAKVITSGIAERIGLKEGIFTIKFDDQKISKNVEIKDHSVAVHLLLDALMEYKVVASLDEIYGAGHRIVQGGDIFDQSVLVDEKVAKTVEELSELAPLHNPAHLIGYNAFKKALPNMQHVFVFDTACHQTIAPD